MRKKEISKALNELIKERAQTKPSHEIVPENTGASKISEYFRSDISSVRVLAGLNILAESLVKSVIEQSVFGRSDVLIEQRVNPDHQPELYSIGVTNLSFYARQTVLENLPGFYDVLAFQIRYMLNSIQKETIYSKLFPVDKSSPCGILFPFHRESGSDITGFYYLMEYIPGGKFIRITLESENDARLRLTRIPHFSVSSIDLIYSKVDISKTSEMLTQGIIEACIQQKAGYNASSVNFDEYIAFLQKWDLPAIEVISFVWNDTFRRFALSGSKKHIFMHITRILFSLCDYDLTAKLTGGQTLLLEDKDFICYVDLSQRNRCLNISFLSPRMKSGLSEHLEKMPALLKTSKTLSGNFDNVHVLLIHHLTGEVLGFIQALINMGAEIIETLWVKYAGAVEPEYKEIILSLPEKIFLFRGLTPVPLENGIENKFILSDEYSPVSGLESLSESLRNDSYNFFKAMNLAAGHILFRKILSCKKQNARFIVIEDGGYIAPDINKLCLENVSVKSAAEIFRFPLDEIAKELPECDPEMSFKKWIEPVFIGSIEHTRNGYEALNKVRTAFGKLAFPALSIAVSDFKVNCESRDVVYSCINAVENILNGMGFVLSERTALVLGAMGALGRKSMRILSDRLGSENLYGVDIVKPEVKPDWTFADALSLLPEKSLKSIDFVFGLIGTSICKPEWIEKLILNTEKRHIFFASGSTKTAEFSDLTDWLAKSVQSSNFKVDGKRISIKTYEVKDPKTNAHQGRSVELDLGEKKVTLHLLADLMPVNFLYYGVPSETMNHVMNELLKTSGILVNSCKTGQNLPDNLLALDHEISAEGKLLKEL